jgi:uncharacterized protein YxeA
MKKILLILIIIGSYIYLSNYFNNHETSNESNLNFDQESIFLVGTWEPILHKNSLNDNWSVVYNGYDLILKSDKTGYLYNSNWEDNKIDIEWSYFKFSQFSDYQGQMLDQLNINVINNPEIISYVPYIDFMNYFGGDENIFTVINMTGSGEQTIFHKMGTIPSKETYINLTIGNQKVTSNNKVDQKKLNSSHNTTSSKSSSWRELKRGMTRQQVKKLLGEPLRVEVFSWGKERWEYGPYSYEKNVEFDKSGLVVGWSE